MSIPDHSLLDRICNATGFDAATVESVATAALRELHYAAATHEMVSM